MPGMSTNPFCVGITAPAPTAFAATNIAGHAMIAVPGGATVFGSHASFTEARPRWVSLSPYWMCETPTIESQYSEVMGRQGRLGAPEDQAVSMVSYRDAIKYIKKKGGKRLALPTEAQWENAARGPAINVKEITDREIAGEITKDGLMRCVGDSLENFVFAFKPGMSIEGGVVEHLFGELEGGLRVTNPLKLDDKLFWKLYVRDIPLYAWNTFDTFSAGQPHEEVFRDWLTTGPVGTGKKNAYGLYDIMGRVWEWVQDWYAEDAYMLSGVDPTGPDKGNFKVLRGGPFLFDNYDRLHVAFREVANPTSHPHKVSYGFRVAASQDSGK